MGKRPPPKEPEVVGISPDEFIGIWEEINEHLEKISKSATGIHRCLLAIAGYLAAKRGVDFERMFRDGLGFIDSVLQQSKGKRR